jgi:N-acetylglutamate synthase-like GNAT family acetyltransferase
MSAVRPQIRQARVDDASEMARLADELGYQMTPAEMHHRLRVLLSNEQHHIAVATSDAVLLGWVHVEHRFSVDGGDRGELMGLVVDSSARRLGVGRELVAVAENWVLTRGVSSLTVRSNVLRKDSHPFYESLGYSRDKTQHVYSKVVTLNQALERTRDG